jgi:Flp pilus assembly pilin Flp
MIREFLLDEDGMGVVEVVLIIVVLVAIAAIFKKQIVALVNNIWTSINKDAKSVYS